MITSTVQGVIVEVISCAADHGDGTDPSVFAR